MKAWDDSDERLQRKRNRAGKSAANAIGGAVGFFILQFFFDVDGNERIAAFKHLIGIVASWALVYGIIVMAVMILRKEAVLMVNSTLVWVVTPLVLVYVVMQAMSSLS